MTPVTDVTAAAVEQRIRGGRPSWLRAFIAAAVIGVSAAVLAFRLLRSGSENSAEGAAAD